MASSRPSLSTYLDRIDAPLGNYEDLSRLTYNIKFPKFLVDKVVDKSSMENHSDDSLGEDQTIGNIVETISVKMFGELDAELGELLFKVLLGVDEFQKFGIHQRVFINFDNLKKEFMEVVPVLANKTFVDWVNEDFQLLLDDFMKLFSAIDMSIAQLIESKLNGFIEDVRIILPEESEVDAESVDVSDVAFLQSDLLVLEEELLVKRVELSQLQGELEDVLLLKREVVGDLVEKENELKELKESVLGKQREIDRLTSELAELEERKLNEIGLLGEKIKFVRDRLMEIEAFGVVALLDGGDDLALKKQDIERIEKKTNTTFISFSELNYLLKEIGGFDLSCDDTFEFLRNSCSIDMNELNPLLNGSEKSGFVSNKLLGKLAVALLVPDGGIPEFGKYRGKRAMIYSPEELNNIYTNIIYILEPDGRVCFSEMVERIGLSSWLIKRLLSPKQTPYITEDQMLKFIQASVVVGDDEIEEFYEF